MEKTMDQKHSKPTTIELENESKQPEYIEMSKWVQRGKLMVRRDALDANDPDHPHNYIKSLGYDPEIYGLEESSERIVCPNCGHVIVDVEDKSL